MQRIAVVAIVGMLAGCGVIRLPGTGGQPAPDAIRVAKAAGNGCAVIIQEGSVDDVAHARMASAGLQAVLASEAPTTSALEAALAAAQAPPLYRALAGTVLALFAPEGGEVILNKDSDVFKAAEAFVSSCTTVLGSGEVA